MVDSSLNTRFQAFNEPRQRLPPEVRIHVLQNFKPPREGEADYSALLMSYCKKMRENQQRVQPLQPAAYASYETRQVPPRAPERPQWNPPAPRRAESNTNIYALEGFRQRYPMDDRAFDFLKCASASTQQEVLERFAPQRQDSDYSALIISFAKRCREREQPQPSFAAKRPRMFWANELEADRQAQGCVEICVYIFHDT